MTGGEACVIYKQLLTNAATRHSVVDVIHALAAEHLGSVVVSLPWSAAVDIDQLAAESSATRCTRALLKVVRNLLDISWQLQLALCPSHVTWKLVLPLRAIDAAALEKPSRGWADNAVTGMRRWHREFSIGHVQAPQESGRAARPRLVIRQRNLDKENLS